MVSRRPNRRWFRCTRGILKLQLRAGQKLGDKNRLYKLDFRVLSIEYRSNSHFLCFCTTGYKTRATFSASQKKTQNQSSVVPARFPATLVSFLGQPCPQGPHRFQSGGGPKVFPIFFFFFFFHLLIKKKKQIALSSRTITSIAGQVWVFQLNLDFHTDSILVLNSLFAFLKVV